jgi:RimJ/RimL family protein N-acetyltransferase
MDFTGYTAKTERMQLRPYVLDDFEAFHDLHSREDVARYLPWETRDVAASRAALEKHQKRSFEVDGDGITLAGFDDETGRLVGEFVLILRSVQHRGAEVGYVLHPDFQGRGFATEGARHMLGIAFDDLELHRVIARLDSRNHPSAAVLRRLGMRHEAHLVENEWFKGEWTDEDDFALLRKEWSAQNARL